MKYTNFPGKLWTFLGLFWRTLWLKTCYMHVFSRKWQKFIIFLGKVQEISALEANIDYFQQILVKYLPLPHPDISLITMIWLKLRFTPLSTKEMLKLWQNRRKIRENSSGVVPYTYISANFRDFFYLTCSKFWWSHQVIDWNCYNCIFFIRIILTQTLMKSLNFYILNIGV